MKLEKASMYALDSKLSEWAQYVCIEQRLDIAWDEELAAKLPTLEPARMPAEGSSELEPEGCAG